MEMVHSHKTLFQLCLLLTLHFSSLLLLSSANSTVPDKYFINCGASSDASFYNGQVFVPDSNSNSPSFLTGKSEQVSNTSAWIPELYQTARVYRQPFSYSFEIGQRDTYIVRLHFFAYLSSRANLYDALFNVSASGFPLLTNFGIRNSSSSPLIKEFLLTIPQGNFIIQFIPSESSSFAFANAIEVFLATETNITDYFTSVTSAGNGGNCQGLLTQVLHTIHRINFGGPQIDYDELWRKWVADDSYLILHSDSAKNSTPYSQTLNYNSELATKYTAPDRVYQTAKQLKTGANGNASLLNLTWSFPVSKNTKHFVRVHFCDIVTKTLNDILFNLYIYSNFVQLIDPYDRTADFAVPFYIDYVVDSDDSGFTNFSLSPSEHDSRILNAFLNGLEIMELISGSMLDDLKPVKKNSPVIEIIGSVGSGAFLILIIVVALRLKCRKSSVPDQSGSYYPISKWCCCCGRYKGKSTRANASPLPKELCRHFSIDDMRTATDNFHQELIIGRGGFGYVYKGFIDEGTMTVAIKRLKPESRQGAQEFRTEIGMLSQLRHGHLVSLIGYCSDEGEMILVYEYMSNGTLSEHLFNTKNDPLTWKQRLEICLGAARGLHYLHTCMKNPIIHRDVKATNILLDDKLGSKVSDFGLSKMGLNQTAVSTMVKGTFGYLDPEYARRQQVTDKSDVYSFGVVLLEVLCGRKALDQKFDKEQLHLANWARKCIERGTIYQIIDSYLKGKIAPECFKVYVEVAESCVRDQGIQRPTMNNVMEKLEFALELQQDADAAQEEINPSGDFTYQEVLSFRVSSPVLELDTKPFLDSDSVTSTSQDIFTGISNTTA